MLPAGTGRLARLLVAGLCAHFGCREPVSVEPSSTPPSSSRGGRGGAASAVEIGSPRAGDEPPDRVEKATGGEPERGESPPPPGVEMPLVECPERPALESCRIQGDPALGVRLVGTLLEPALARSGGVLDIDAAGNVRCVACDCGDAAGALIIECPGLIVTPGFINLHDHLGYAGTPPLAHPGELYEHRNDWRLGENGHAALPFSGNASAAQVLAHELRMVMGGATSIVGAGGRRGLLRNLDVPGLGERALPGSIRSETFPLDDARGSVDGASCRFGSRPDSAAAALASQAYVAHLGEGTSRRAHDELRCALGSLNLLGANSAVVHAMALSRSDAVELARRGASVVWSPRSNLDLYGRTAPVALLSSLGVRIALGSDWLASGSMNLLRELACAKQYDHEVLGGYFGPAELWRMVTENAAWALGLEGRLGALRAGLAADIAVFQSEGADPFADVVGAGPAGVRLVLRQGRALYGDAELVQALGDAGGCEELDVCGEPRRACVAETGRSLAAIRAAGEAVYPLFSCGEPPGEPSCAAVVERECAWGETECEAPPGPAPASARDADGDGVPDAIDVCPRVADAAQHDRDGDGRGDACDPCPLANPGLSPCPSSIAGLRAPGSRLARGTAVALRGVRVTALRSSGARGFYVEDGDRAAYSGLFVYTDAALPGVAVGDSVELQGYFDTYQGTDELVESELLGRSASAVPYAPLTVPLADAADGSERADGLASLFVRIEGVFVELTNPDSPKDYDETLLRGGLRLDDLLFPELDNVFEPNTGFGAVQGILGFSFGHRKLFPRGAEDLIGIAAP